MWLMEEVTTNMGRDQKALRNLRLISPSGMAIRKVMNKMAKSAYHFVASGHSRNVIATAHIVIYKMSSMGHRTKRILRIERKEYQTY